MGRISDRFEVFHSLLMVVLSDIVPLFKLGKATVALEPQ